MVTWKSMLGPHLLNLRLLPEKLKQATTMWKTNRFVEASRSSVSRYKNVVRASVRLKDGKSVESICESVLLINEIKNQMS